MTFHAMTEHYEEITDCSRALFSSCASPPQNKKSPDKCLRIFMWWSIVHSTRT